MGEYSSDAAETEGESSEAEPDPILQTATEKPAANLIADIVGHPKELPSVEELVYHNPSLSETEIQRHLKTLEEAGIIVEHTVENDEQSGTQPQVFYGLTDNARHLFDTHNLFPRKAWQRTYDAVEKTSRIQRLEELSRP